MLELKILNDIYQYEGIVTWTGIISFALFIIKNILHVFYLLFYIQAQSLSIAESRVVYVYNEYLQSTVSYISQGHNLSHKYK